MHADYVTLEDVKKNPEVWWVLAEYVDGVPMYRRLMTDEEITQAAREEWLSVLSRLWIAFDKPLDAERLTICQRELEMLPLGLLELSVSRAIREHKYNSVPTISDVWTAARKELHNPHDIDQAIRQWKESLWRRAILLDSNDVQDSVVVETA